MTADSIRFPLFHLENLAQNPLGSQVSDLDNLAQNPLGSQETHLDNLVGNHLDSQVSHLVNLVGNHLDSRVKSQLGDQAGSHHGNQVTNRQLNLLQLEMR